MDFNSFDDLLAECEKHFHLEGLRDLCTEAKIEKSGACIQLVAIALFKLASEENEASSVDVEFAESALELVATQLNREMPYIESLALLRVAITKYLKTNKTDTALLSTFTNLYTSLCEKIKRYASRAEAQNSYAKSGRDPHFEDEDTQRTILVDIGNEEERYEKQWKALIEDVLLWLPRDHEFATEVISCILQNVLNPKPFATNGKLRMGLENIGGEVAKNCLISAGASAERRLERLERILRPTIYPYLSNNLHLEERRELFDKFLDEVSSLAKDLPKDNAMEGRFGALFTQLTHAWTESLELKSDDDSDCSMNQDEWLHKFCERLMGIEVHVKDRDQGLVSAYKVFCDALAKPAWSALPPFTVQDIHDMIEKKEGQLTEFKEDAGDDKQLTGICEEICAFANTNRGGTILLGVADDGRIKGIIRTADDWAGSILNVIRDLFKPQLVIRTEEIVVEVENEEPKIVFAVRIPPRRRSEVFQFRGRIWVRKASRKQDTTPDEKRDLFQGKHLW